MSPADLSERQLVDNLIHHMNDAEFTYRSGSFDYDIVWDDGIPMMHSWGMMLEGCPAARRLTQEPRPVLQRATRALLTTLDDPSRFASAHWTLVQMSEPPASPSLGAQARSLQEYPTMELEEVVQRDRSAGCLRSSYDRLPVALMHDGQREMADGGNWGPLMRGVAKFNTSQLPLIRDQWHRRLDVQIWPTIGFRTIVIASLVLPTISLARALTTWLRTRRRRQRGLCLQCGYDLRAAAGRCPECGVAARPWPVTV
jgi:hypothetical protein